MELAWFGSCVAASIEATVIRADGRIRALGRIAYWHRDPLRRLPWEARCLARCRAGAIVFSHAGKAIVTDRIKGAGGAEPREIGWGTGAGTASAADSGLFAEKATDLSSGTGTRTTGASSLATTAQANDTYRVVGTRTATGAGTVTNAGLFDDNAIGAGAMLLKGDFAGIGLSSGDSIQFTMSLQFT
jgi:hypothetical protein